MRTINFGKYFRLFQIEPIKTVEIRFVHIEKIGAKISHTVDPHKIFSIAFISHENISSLYFGQIWFFGLYRVITTRFNF